MSDNALYIQDFTTAYIMPWQTLPTTYSVEPKLSTRASNLSDPGPKAYEFVARDLGATASIGYTVSHGAYATFCDWYRDALKFGKRWFFILLPSGAGPSWVTARFTEPYTAKPIGGRGWEVSMAIEIRKRALQVNTIPIPFILTCLSEDFNNGFSGYTILTGHQGPFALVDSPFGKAITAVPTSSADNDSTLAKQYSSSLLLRSVKLKFQLLNQGSDDAFISQVRDGLGSLVVSINPRREVTFGAGHFQLQYQGTVYDDSLVVDINTWLEVDLEIQPANSTSFFTVRDATTHEIVLVHMIDGSQTLIPVDTLAFFVDSIPNLSETQYTDIDACAKSGNEGFIDLPAWTSSIWSVPVGGSSTISAHVASGATSHGTARTGTSHTDTKRYIELTFESFTGGTAWLFGTCDGRHAKDVRLGTIESSNAFSSAFDLNAHNVKIGGSVVATIPTISAGQVLMLAVDCTTGKVWLGVNGTWTSGDPALGTSPLFTQHFFGYQLCVGVDVTTAGSDLDATCVVSAKSSTVSFAAPVGFTCWDDI